MAQNIKGDGARASGPQALTQPPGLCAPLSLSLSLLSVTARSSHLLDGQAELLGGAAAQPPGSPDTAGEMRAQQSPPAQALAPAFNCGNFQGAAGEAGEGGCHRWRLCPELGTHQ